MTPRLADALRHASLADVKSQARPTKARDARTCDGCGATIPAGSRYMRANVTIRAYRSAADIGNTSGDVRFCAACLPVTP